METDAITATSEQSKGALYLASGLRNAYNAKLKTIQKEAIIRRVDVKLTTATASHGCDLAQARPRHS